MSPLVAEPLPALTGDIYYDDSSDSGRERAAKRRRIEKLGEQYLRGDGLQIMTASLRGPLVGWKNPWARPKRKSVNAKAIGSAEAARPEVPETTHRVQAKARRVVSTATDFRDASGRKPAIEADEPKHAGVGHNWLKKADGLIWYAHSPRDPSPTPLPSSRKAKEDVRHLNAEKLRLSPESPRLACKSRDLSPIAPQKAHQIENLGLMRILSANTTGSSVPANSNEDVKQDRLLQTITLEKVEILAAAKAAAASSTSTSPLHTATVSVPLNAETENGSSTDATTTFKKARSKQRSVHTVPPSTHLPEFEYRHAADTPKLPFADREKEATQASPATARKPRHLYFASSVEIPAAQHTEQIGTEQAPEGCQDMVTGSDGRPASRSGDHVEEVTSGMDNASVAAGRMPPPSLSTQVSSTTATNQLPSAQVVSIVQPPPTESNHSSAGNMLEPMKSNVEPSAGENLVSAKAAVDQAGGTGPEHGAGLEKLAMSPAHAIRPNGIPSDARQQSREGIVPFSAFKSLRPNPSICDLDTQEMLAAITPLVFTTDRKPPWTSITKATPSTATRPKAKKAKKRASFAAAPDSDAISSGSPQGSIKMSLKVSKTVSDGGIGKEVSMKSLTQPSPYGRLGLDMETSDEGGSMKEGESLPALASLLRGHKEQHNAGPTSSNLPVSSAFPITATTTTSTASGLQQEAQQLRDKRIDDGQNGIDEQDDFNLSSAMDDLGSFLGTWDPDKEARELDVTSSHSKPALKRSAFATSSMAR